MDYWSPLPGSVAAVSTAEQLSVLLTILYVTGQLWLGLRPLHFMIEPYQHFSWRVGLGVRSAAQ